MRHFLKINWTGSLVLVVQFQTENILRGNVMPFIPPSGAVKPAVMLCLSVNPILGPRPQTDLVLVYVTPVGRMVGSMVFTLISLPHSEPLQ